MAEENRRVALWISKTKWELVGSCDDRCEIKNPLKAWRLMVIYSIESQLCGTSVEERSAGVTGTAAVSP